MSANDYPLQIALTEDVHDVMQSEAKAHFRHEKVVFSRKRAEYGFEEHGFKH